MKKKLAQCIRQGGFLEVVDINWKKMPPLTHLYAVPLVVSGIDYIGLLKDAGSHFSFFFSPLHEKHTYWLFPFKGYIPKISHAECVRQWSRWNHARETLSLPEMPFWSQVRGRGKKTKQTTKPQRQAGVGRSRENMMVLVKSFTHFSLTHTCTHTCYFTLWHSLLEEFSGLSCFWRLYYF